VKKTEWTKNDVEAMERDEKIGKRREKGRYGGSE